MKTTLDIKKENKKQKLISQENHQVLVLNYLKMSKYFSTQCCPICKTALYLGSQTSPVVLLVRL